MIRNGSELVGGQNVENVRGGFFEHLVHPDVLERDRRPQQIDDDAGEVDVAHDHDVELAEQLQLLQIHGSLSVGGGGLLQMSDRPDDGEQNGAAADQID